MKKEGGGGKKKSKLENEVGQEPWWMVEVMGNICRAIGAFHIPQPSKNLELKY